MSNESLLPTPLTASVVRSYIDFDGHPAAAAGAPSMQARLQSEGVAGLWELLRQQDFAYLADEVGMGKTRQAMGVIATQFLSKPDSRVVIVCSSATLQRQWQSEWSQFLGTCYRLLDDRLLSADATRLEELHMHQNLREFARSLHAGEARIHLLRYSSFSKPLSLDADSPARMLEEYARVLGVAGVAALHPDERALGARHAGQSAGWDDTMRHELAAAWCKRISQLLTHGTRRAAAGQDEAREPLDLVVFDEAQYLRHTGNFQNRHIATIFRRNVQRWLFLSATPLHSSTHDIRSLDAYLCRHAPAPASAEKPSAAGLHDCGEGEHHKRCPRLTWRLGKMPGKRPDVVEVLQEMMIRRTRTYADGCGRPYCKVEYRHYEKIRHSGAADPFLALTMALVQKRLVGALAGRNNKFRQGECASFESLSSSVGRILRRSRTQPAEPELPREYEPVADGKHEPEPGMALDRNVIDGLNQSFGRAMPLAAGHGLPHAKLHRTVDELFERSLLDGSTEKTLVFVRRIDTVEEMRDLLHLKFQREVDARIEAWRELLSGDEPALTAGLWQGEFWTHHGRIADDGPMAEHDDPLEDEAEVDDDAPDAGGATHNRGFREQANLAYFEALKKRSGSRERHGKLVSFRTRLLVHGEMARSPLRGFLQGRPGESSSPDDAGQVENRQRWQRLLAALFGAKRAGELAAIPAHAWLFADPCIDAEESFKLAALQLCLLQVMRQTDFLVDLFILHNHLERAPDGATALPEKILWLFECEPAQLPPKLARYVANMKVKLRHWVEHFDLIVDKCFRAGAAADWATIYRDRISPAFRLMAPVIGRSGRVANVHAVSQFKFPSHPNILVCTDVLKEGVDMHLFCDRVVHYGVAWTSGDLEQRIGRVDRFGSLISRRLMLHPGGGAAVAPQLNVAFPYLDGTLDKYQVNRVIRDKIFSDMRMDLGKRKDELGEVDASHLSGDEFLPTVAPDAENRAGGVFFPPAIFARISADGEALRLPPEIGLKGAADVVRARTRADDAAPENVFSLPAYDALVVRRAVDPGHAALRCTTGENDSAPPRWTEEFMVVRGCPLHGSPARELAADGGPYGVSRPPAATFSFSAEMNTCIATVRTGDVGGAGEQDLHVSLESIGDEFWLLRCFVQPAEACDVKGRRNAVQSWLAERNGARTFGYLMEDVRDIWFGLVVRKSGGAEAALLERLVPRVARMALYYRRRTVDQPSQIHRALTAFPTPTENLQWTNLMKQNDALACGNILTGVQAWFEQAFEAALSELYGPQVPAGARGLSTEPMTFLPGGVLHLVATGQEYFALQAFLDLNGLMHGNGVHKGPGMWWELAVSPNFKGPKPRLPVSEVDEMPHALPDVWESELRDGCAAYTSVGERAYRYLSLHHSPAVWDRSRARIMPAWGEVLGKMRELNNFQRVRCREILVEALEPRKAQALEKETGGQA